MGEIFEEHKPPQRAGWEFSGFKPAKKAINGN
jgi:hypothetical protein